MILLYLVSFRKQEKKKIKLNPLIRSPLFLVYSPLTSPHNLMNILSNAKDRMIRNERERGGYECVMRINAHIGK